MIFFDPNRQRVVSIAKEVLNQVNQSGEAPDMILNKIAQSYGLNDHWKQRIVEEFNIQAFLQKLQEGTQHEHYQLANPVIDEAEQWVGVPMDEPIPEGQDKDIEKTASYMEKVAFYQEQEPTLIPLDAFEYKTEEEFTPFPNMMVVADEFDDSIELEKIAYEKEMALKEVQREELIKEASYAISQYEDKVLGELIKIANISPGFAKLIIHDLSKTAAAHYAEDILIGVKHKPKEIKDASIYDDVAPYEFEKLASVKTLIEELTFIKPLKNGVAKGKEKFIVAAKKLKNHPIGAIMALLGIRGIHKALNEDLSEPVLTNIKAFADE